MSKEIIKQKLDKFDYEFYEKGNKLIVELGFSLDMEIEFTVENKIEIKDKLRGWNFLTGMFEMSIKNSIVFSTVFSFILALSFLLINYKPAIENSFLGIMTLFVFILTSFWLLLWTNYFLTKAESFKKLIEFIDR